MSDETDETILVLVRRGPGESTDGHIPGTILTLCSECGHECFIAPSGVTTTYRRICIECSQQMDIDNDDGMRMHRAALIEAAKALGINPTVILARAEALGFIVAD